ncbi:MAG: hypothetical protein HETSPECPRED_009543 [Heterodermia speciosa]|uniref:PQ loop repeat protein n=1 Tax=Heterodermia speciosa TaxID=116794 RepID=A0A8H3EPR1_9LECA|nr:MAG: hypothetical protein HETSPECPRED_009543 [Heterodermia speciosa]
MAPQTSIPVAANVLGTIATILWSIQLIPQIISNWRKKKTDGLPGAMMFLWAISAVPFGVYGIVQNFNIPLQIQPQVFCVLSLVSWFQILVFNNGWRICTAFLLTCGIAVAFGAVEALLILTLRDPYARGISWPMTAVGVIAAILLGAGILPPYFEIWKRGGRCIGINWYFLGLDWMGAFISLMALVAQNTFDYLGGVLYLVVLLLETGIFATHLIWRIRTRSLHRRAKAEGVDFDDLPEAKKYQVPSDGKITTPASSSQHVELGTGGYQGEIQDAARPHRWSSDSRASG